jgi:ribosomal protein S18 acetylase RimI-like enzyme
VIPIAIRLGRPSDLPYVVDTWAKRGRTHDERIGQATARVRALLARPESVFRVACLPDDDDAILGWTVVTTADELVYVYVRKDARGQSVARRLLAGIDWPKSENPGK